jgi:predicted transcriptional regulator
MDDLALAFLRDVEAYPECGIAERYKRLGISVRQGQKLKFRLLEADLIEDHEELTHTGRIHKMRLTTKGRHFIATFGSNHRAPH